jgi:hypothetical protein
VTVKRIGEAETEEEREDDETGFLTQMLCVEDDKLITFAMSPAESAPA